MTRKLNESIPFADIEDEEAINRIQSSTEMLLNSAFESKELDELTYRRLSIEVREVHGDPYDWFNRIIHEHIDALETNMLDRLIKADEYINAIGPDNPKYGKAVDKYERLHDQFRRSKEWRQ